MRIRTGVYLLACCAALAGCTAAARKGPDTTVTTPAVGRPPAPASAQAAFSSEAFTPYAGLGWVSDDGLAPGESFSTLSAACMTAAGYPGAGSSNLDGHGYNVGVAGGLWFGPPWGGWGYLGAADAQQYGFLVPLGPAASTMGVTVQPPSLTTAEQAAADKCSTALWDLWAPVISGPWALIRTLDSDISADVAQDPAVKTATRAWSACMARNGYSFPQPGGVYNQETAAVYGPHSGSSSAAAANRAQLAVAVADAGCTSSSDLAGIYFAVQASYEQQIVTANQQALTATVSAYRADYKKALTKLAARLRTAKAQPFPQAKTPTPRASNSG
jgi:hypothetical protein